MGFSHKKPPGTAVGHRDHKLMSLQGEGLACPPVPQGLLKPARDRWEAYWSSDVSRALDIRSDLPRLERWVKMTDEYDRVARVLKGARLVKGSQGQPVMNPLAGYLSQLEASISRCETEFGMTPMARLRLGIALGDAKRSLEDLNRDIEQADDADDDERFHMIEAIDADSA